MQGACTSDRLRAALLGVLVALGSLAGVAPIASAQSLGSVSGTVRSAGAPVANAWVTLMPVTATGAWAGRPTQTTTDQDGRYQFRDLDAAHVKIQVRAPSFSGLTSTYWPDAYSFVAAGTLRVAPSGSTADIDLSVGGSITGRVVDADTGEPIPGAQVVAHVDAAPGWEQVGSTGLASGSGQFVIDGLPPLPVALQVRAAQGSNHLGQWYDGVGFQGRADRVAPGASGLVVRLREGGQVSGVVRDDRGAPAVGATVTIVGCPALCPMVARADDAGAYRINGVPPGPGLRAYAAAPGDLLSRWYAAPGESGDTSFDLARGQERSDVDFALIKGAVVVGRILDAQTGEPIPGVSVDLVDVDNPLHSYLSRGVEEPGPDSDLVIGPIPPGEYSLIVYPGGENRDFLPVEVVDSSGLDGPGRLDLARGERAGFRVSLARQRMTPPAGQPPGRSGAVDPAAGQADPDASAGGWPGLYRGFLATQGVGLMGLRA